MNKIINFFSKIKCMFSVYRKTKRMRKLRKYYYEYLREVALTTFNYEKVKSINEFYGNKVVGRALEDSHNGICKMEIINGEEAI